MRAAPTVKRRSARTTSLATGPGAGWSSPACSRSSSTRIATSRSSTRRTRRTTVRSIIAKVIDHCERQRFRFAVIDCDRDAEPSGLDPRGLNHWDSSYAAFYAPWIRVSNPQSGATEFVPPGGHVLGIYARTDTERGVFKAPANEIVRGALDLRFAIDEGTQETLNPRGVNVIRSFPGRGIRVWGARTLSSDALWKYVPVRRLFIFLERSI